jgi:L-threonylcarbamoyladenylate synthase
MIDFHQMIDGLKAGQTILYPTDTIWGLGCDATNPEAIEKIYQIKKRNPLQPLIILVDNERRLQELVEVPEVAWNIIDMSEKPITIIYDKAKNLPKNLLAADGSIGIRMVKDKFCQRLIGGLNKPLVSTSANLSGQPSPLCFSDISPEITRAVDLVVPDPDNKKALYTGSSILKITQDARITVIRP